MAGVPLLKVSGFVALGLVAGLTVGGGIVAVAMSGVQQVAIAQPPVAAIPSAVPVAPAAPVVTAAPPPVAPLVPPAALSALRQSAVVNQRLLADADLLATALGATKPSSAEIAPTPARPRIDRFLRRSTRACGRQVG